MLKKIIATTLVATALMFSGCGETDSVGDSQLSAQIAIDGGDYAAAISALEAKAASQRTDDDNLLLASAYMGKAGFSLTDIIIDIQASTSTTASTDNLTAFKDSVIGGGVSSTQLADIETAITYYEQIDGITTLAPSLATAADYGVDDTKLKLGLAYIIKFMIVLNETSNPPTAADLTALSGIANDAFNFILRAAPTDLKSNVQDVKNDVDTDFNGTISDSEMQALLDRI